MPYTEKQRKKAGAELGRRQRGEAPQMDMTEAQLKKMASKKHATRKPVRRKGRKR